MSTARKRLLWLGFSIGVTACEFPYPDPIDGDAAVTADAADDGAPGVLGGATLAQLTFPNSRIDGALAAAPDGGVIVVLDYSHTTQPNIAGTTIPCTTCAIVMKLDPDLTRVDWYAYSDAFARLSHLALSPDGSIYWALSQPGEGDYVVNINGSEFPVPIIVSGQGDPGEVRDAGGARIVVALSSSGSPRWSHVVRQTNVSTGTLSDFQSFAASDSAVVSTYGGLGTVTYTDSGGAAGSLQLASSHFLIHELDPSTGRTVQLAARPNSVAGDGFAHLEGIAGYAGKGFLARRLAYAANGTQTGTSISLGRLGNGGFTFFVNYPTTPAAGTVFEATPARFAGLAAAAATVQTTVEIGSETFTAPSTSGDAFFFVLDSASATVLATGAFGGSSREDATAAVDADDDSLYCVGLYRSTNLEIGGVQLPDPIDALSPGVFLTRTAYDASARSLIPVWTRGIAGTSTMSIADAAADAVTHDLYVLGTAPADTDFGLGEVDAGGMYVIRVRRGS